MRTAGRRGDGGVREECEGRGRRGGGDGGFGVRRRRRVRAGAVLEDGGEGGVPAVLRAAGDRVGECAPAAEGRAMFAGCFLRHSTRSFFQVSKRREDRGEKILN